MTCDKNKIDHESKNIDEENQIKKKTMTPEHTIDRYEIVSKEKFNEKKIFYRVIFSCL